MAAKLLLVEDDVLLSSMLTSILQDNGFSVCLCEDVQSAMEVGYEEHFDLYIFDVKLPSGDRQKVDSRNEAQNVFSSHAAGDRIFLKKHRLSPSGIPCFDEKANAQSLESTFCTSHTSKPSALSFALLSAGLMGVVALSLLGYMWHSTPAMLGFAFVCIAAVLDVVANLLLKASNGFSKLGYGLGAVAVVIGAFYLLMLALDSMELAVAYSSWGAIGIIGTIAGGRILFGERLNAIGYVGVVLVIAAVGLLHEII